MTQQDDLFTPEEVDEQIDRLSRSLEERAIRQDDAPTLHLMRDMRRLYQAGSQDDAHSLERAWGRIARQSRYALRQGDEHEPSIGVFADQHERWRHRMQQNTPVPSRWQTAQRRIGMIAAIAFLAILVGSLVVVLNIARRGTTTGHPGNNPPPAGVLATSSPAVPPTPDANIGKVVYTRHEQQMNDVYQLAWSPDSTRIADANDMNFESWDATTGKHNLTYSAGNFGGYAVQWSPDGKRVAGSWTSVYIWDAVSGKLLLTYSKQASGGFTPTPTPTPLPGTPTPTPLPPMTPTLSPSANSVAGIFADADFLSPNQQQVPGSGGNVVLQNVWSPDGTLMASAFSGAGYGNVVYVWNTSTGKTLLTYRGNTNYITALAWSPNGKYIASSDINDTVQIWDAATGKLLVKLTGIYTDSLAWSPDSTRIVTGGGDVKVWNAMTGKLLLTHPGFSGGVISVAWSSDGTRIASAGTHIEIWNAQTGKTIYTFTRNPNEERTIAWSPNGKYIASATGPGESGPVEIQVWIAS